MSAFAVIYSPAALDDLRSVFFYISNELSAPQAAKNTLTRIRTEVRKLSHFPEKHPLVEWEPWTSMGMRIMPVKDYAVYYLTDTENATVTIIRIFYSGRNIEHLMQKDFG